MTSPDPAATLRAAAARLRTLAAEARSLHAHADTSHGPGVGDAPAGGEGGA